MSKVDLEEVVLTPMEVIVTKAEGPTVDKERKAPFKTRGYQVVGVEMNADGPVVVESEWKHAYSEWGVLVDAIKGEASWFNLRTGERRPYTGEDEAPDAEQREGE